MSSIGTSGSACGCYRLQNRNSQSFDDTSRTTLAATRELVANVRYIKQSQGKLTKLFWLEVEYCSRFSNTMLYPALY